MTVVQVMSMREGERLEVGLERRYEFLPSHCSPASTLRWVGPVGGSKIAVSDKIQRYQSLISFLMICPSDENKTL